MIDEVARRAIQTLRESIGELRVWIREIEDLVPPIEGDSRLIGTVDEVVELVVKTLGEQKRPEV